MSEKHVLVVDDEEDLTWSISRNLQKDKAAFNLTCVNAGQKAIEVMSQFPIDVLVSDIRMPDINGLDLLVEVKNKYPQTKVIIMTAYGSPDVRKEATQRGSLYYLEKPFEINELRNLIYQALEERRGFQGQVSGLQLVDIIQLNCISHSTAIISVEQGSKNGKIYFEDGNIIHAECGDINGEEAFYTILSWEGGDFTTQKGQHSPQQTIDKNWNSLILEGMQRIDESGENNSGTDTKEDTPFNDELQKHLTNFSSIAGFISATIIDANGSPIATVKAKKIEEKIDMTVLGNLIISGIEYAQSLIDGVETQSFEKMTIEFQNMTIFLNVIPEKQEILAVITKANANLGNIRLTTKKMIKKLSKVLS